MMTPKEYASDCERRILELLATISQPERKEVLRSIGLNYCEGCGRKESPYGKTVAVQCIHNLAPERGQARRIKL